jgi:hypothetical protein
MSTVRISIADMTALRVRTSGPANSKPKFLYQCFPANLMSVMATIPYGTPAVSIGQQGDICKISEALPPIADGFIIVYARKPENRYEAFEVRFQGLSFGIAQFCEYASRWMEENVGRLKILAGRYAYLSPTREEWEVILRDGGYTALDPSRMSFEITPHLLQRRMDPFSSGVVARIPVHTGSGLPQSTPSMAFARVELTPDPHPGPHCKWISFVEYQRMRTVQSRPPGSIVPQFREWMERLAKESGFESWVFRPGMFFYDRIEWWGDKNRRRTLHEGIDFAEGVTPDRIVQGISEGTSVRAIADGEIVTVLDDFLNQTMILRHQDIRNENGDCFHTLFSHISPRDGRMGIVSKGQLLGNVAKLKPGGAPAHLHLTGAWIPEYISESELSMDHIHPAFTPIVLINFNSLISGQPAESDPNIQRS